MRVTLVCCVCVKGTHTTRWSKRERKVVHSFRPWCWCMMKSGERALPNTSSGLGGPTALFCRSCRRHCWGHQGFEVHMQTPLQLTLHLIITLDASHHQQGGSTALPRSPVRCQGPHPSVHLPSPLLREGIVWLQLVQVLPDCKCAAHMPIHS